jgi:hypothetical protein
VRGTEAEEVRGALERYDGWLGGAASWESRDLSVPRYGQILLSDGQRYWLLSSDLSAGVLQPAGI